MSFGYQDGSFKRSTGSRGLHQTAGRSEGLEIVGKEDQVYIFSKALHSLQHTFRLLRQHFHAFLFLLSIGSNSTDEVVSLYTKRTGRSLTSTVLYVGDLFLQVAVRTPLPKLSEISAQSTTFESNLASSNFWEW